MFNWFSKIDAVDRAVLLMGGATVAFVVYACCVRWGDPDENVRLLYRLTGESHGEQPDSKPLTKNNVADTPEKTQSSRPSN